MLVENNTFSLSEWSIVQACVYTSTWYFKSILHQNRVQGIIGWLSSLEGYVYNSLKTGVNHRLLDCILKHSRERRSDGIPNKFFEKS